MRESIVVTHKRMAAIRSKNTGIELLLRKRLFSLGYRYRIHYNVVLGSPDIAFPAKKIAIFCDSNFWHGYKFDILKRKLNRNKRFWVNKISRNKKRDRAVTQGLREEGWLVFRFWEDQIKNNIEECIKKFKGAYSAL
ncbi:MAG: very short patch repair endonuclease [Candidatus Babeliales bacterium]